MWGGVVTTKEFFKLRMTILEAGNFLNAAANFMVGNNIKYITGYPNSYLNNWYYNSFIGTVLHKDRTLFYIDDILKIFILPISPTNQAIVSQIEALVNKILAAKKEHPVPSGHPSTRGEYPQADTSHWEREIDRLVYKLYGLTEEEIRITEK